MDRKWDNKICGNPEAAIGSECKDTFNKAFSLLIGTIRIHFVYAFSN